ncbi:MAG: sel1 repeat family protein [Deltaproteobacteria bacterium]|nr:sel1 repeat family protein [Deltaproteobacteria bacterium]
MRNLALVLLFLGSSTGFAGGSWKSAGEYFENKYLSGLQEMLKSGESKAGNIPSSLPLKQAFLIYQLEAQRGDKDAQFRVAALYEKNGFKEQAMPWFEKAAAGGNKYADDHLKGPEDGEVIDADEYCRFFGGLLFSNRKGNSDAAHFVESLALQGNSACMLALGTKNKSPYWLQRAVLASSSGEIEGRAF